MSVCEQQPLTEAQQFENDGFLLWTKAQYDLTQGDELASELKKYYWQSLELDKSKGSRYRAYLKLQWQRDTDTVSIAADQRYFQSKAANNMDGGSCRHFKAIDSSMMNDPVFSKMLAHNTQFIRDYAPLADQSSLIFGIHFVRYFAEPGSISYSSPVWLHVDDEPLVFVHLIDLSENAIGGDNIVANKEGELLSSVRLQNFFDTVALNRNVKHAVTPLGANGHEAYRDIILFTVEPDTTNHLADK